MAVKLETQESTMHFFSLLEHPWAIRVIWHLNDGPLTFRELQERCSQISPSTLNKRLKEFRDAFLVNRVVGGYALTIEGQYFYELLKPLSNYASDWSRHLEDD